MNPPIRSPLDELGLNLTRRRFFEHGSHLLGGAALASLLGNGAAFGNASTAPTAGIERVAGAIGPHFAPKAKHVIYLHMVGGPPSRISTTTSRRWTTGTTKTSPRASATASGSPR